ncbi:MAG: PhoH family protein [Oscillospiraceae bacterium]|nr:PhoH family protein [Oscillospiraceae bacterium]
MTERILNADRIEQLISVFGSFDENVSRIEQAFHVQITTRGTELKVSGSEEDTDRGARALEALMNLAAKDEEIDEQKVRYLIDMVQRGEDDKVQELSKDVICVTAKGKPIKAKTLGQQKYVRAIQNHTITVGVGPAGTGKTYLAVAEAVTAFRQKKVNRIILTRPAVEAGERLGFLPGDLQNKVDPYLRPLYDALFDMLGPETFSKYQERGDIEVAPLAYMRGRTLDESFIILDEAQNTTREQMKMFLTRLGFGSKIVITGDVTQIDLPTEKVSGLKEAVRVLDGIQDIAICRLTASDVVRHALVQQIVSAYESFEKHSQPLPGKTYQYKRKREK